MREWMFENINIVNHYIKNKINSLGLANEVMCYRNTREGFGKNGEVIFSYSTRKRISRHNIL